MGFLSTLSRVGIGVLAVYLATACTTPVNDAVVNPEPPPVIEVPIEPDPPPAIDVPSDPVAPLDTDQILSDTSEDIDPTVQLIVNTMPGGTVEVECEDECRNSPQEGGLMYLLEYDQRALITATPAHNYEFVQWLCPDYWRGSCPIGPISANPLEVRLGNNLTILTIQPLFKVSIPTIEFVPEGFDVDSYSVDDTNATLQANDFEIALGRVNGGLLNPLLEVYDEVDLNVIHTTSKTPDYRPGYNPGSFEEVWYHSDSPRLEEGRSTDEIGIIYPAGTPGLPGVDVDRSTLRVVNVSQPAYGVVEITADGKNISYVPNADLGDIADSDMLTYTVQTSEDGITKTASGTITIHLEDENLAQNTTELENLLSANFTRASTDREIGENFRFSDDVISNEDLRILRYFVENEFSEESIRAIVSIPEDISPIRQIDKHSLRKLLAIENGLFKNQNFGASTRGFNSWPDDYAGIMRQAAFAVPQFVEIIESSKTINYLKSDLDEIFPSLGGKYTGFFSRGENYTPIYACKEDLVRGDPSYYWDDTDSSECWYHTSGWQRWYDKITDDNSYWNELVIHFSMLAVLDEFQYTIGKPLVAKATSEFSLLLDHPNEHAGINPYPSGVVATYGYLFSWENAMYDNGEVTNVYSLLRGIIGMENLSVAQTLLKLMNWSIDYTYHFQGRPYYPRPSGNRPEERNKLASLPNDNAIPPAYGFMLHDLGGVPASGSRLTSALFAAALRSLNIQSKQLWLYYNNTQIVVDGESWYFEANFPLGAGTPVHACRALVHEDEVTDVVIENHYVGWDAVTGLGNPDKLKDLIGVSTWEFDYEQTEFCEKHNPEVLQNLGLAP